MNSSQQLNLPTATSALSLSNHSLSNQPMSARSDLTDQGGEEAPEFEEEFQKEADPRDRYQLLEKIGEGGYGSVFKAWDLHTCTTVAVKLIDLEGVGDELEEVNQEILIMSNIKCPQLIKYYASHILGMNLWIIMEYLEAGSIADLIKQSGPLDEKSVAYVISELLLALEYLHSERKIHRDVKAGNLLLSADAGVKLADFGVTGQLTDSMDKRRTRVGTPFWMSPEVITQSSYDGCADIWSTGITAIELARGLPPYAKEIHPMQVIFLIPKNPPPVLEGNFSDDFKDFVAQCLKKDRLSRPTASELLLHPFIVNAQKPDSFTANVNQKIFENQQKQQADADQFESSGLIRMNSSDSGWDFTMRTNMSNVSIHGASKSSYNLMNNNMNSSHSMHNILCNNDEVLRRKYSISSMIIDHNRGSDLRNVQYEPKNNSSNSTDYNNSNNNNNNNNMIPGYQSKNNFYEEKNMKNSGPSGLTLKNPGALFPHTGDYGPGVKNVTKSLRATSREHTTYSPGGRMITHEGTQNPQNSYNFNTNYNDNNDSTYSSIRSMNNSNELLHENDEFITLRRQKSDSTFSPHQFSSMSSTGIVFKPIPSSSSKLIKASRNFNESSPVHTAPRRASLEGGIGRVCDARLANSISNNIVANFNLSKNNGKVGGFKTSLSGGNIGGSIGRVSTASYNSSNASYNNTYNNSYNGSYNPSYNPSNNCSNSNSADEMNNHYTNNSNNNYNNNNNNSGVRGSNSSCNNINNQNSNNQNNNQNNYNNDFRNHKTNLNFGNFPASKSYFNQSVELSVGEPKKRENREVFVDNSLISVSRGSVNKAENTPFPPTSNGKFTLQNSSNGSPTTPRGRAMSSSSSESELSIVSEATSLYNENSFNQSLENDENDGGKYNAESPRSESGMGAGIAPFKSVLTVLLRHASRSQLSDLFQKIIRPALQRVSDLTNSDSVADGGRSNNSTNNSSVGQNTSSTNCNSSDSLDNVHPANVIASLNLSTDSFGKGKNGVRAGTTIVNNLNLNLNLNIDNSNSNNNHTNGYNDNRNNNGRSSLTSNGSSNGNSMSNIMRDNNRDNNRDSNRDNNRDNNTTNTNSTNPTGGMIRRGSSKNVLLTYSNRKALGSGASKANLPSYNSNNNNNNNNSSNNSDGKKSSNGSNNSNNSNISHNSNSTTSTNNTNNNSSSNSKKLYNNNSEDYVSQRNSVDALEDSCSEKSEKSSKSRKSDKSDKSNTSKNSQKSQNENGDNRENGEDKGDGKTRKSKEDKKDRKDKKDRNENGSSPNRGQLSRTKKNLQRFPDMKTDDETQRIDQSIINDFFTEIPKDGSERSLFLAKPADSAGDKDSDYRTNARALRNTLGAGSLEDHVSGKKQYRSELDLNLCNSQSMSEFSQSPSEKGSEEEKFGHTGEKQEIVLPVSEKRKEKSETHRLETQDLVTVLIAVMTALDQHTDGALTNEFATTMMGFMMEELDGNVF